MLLSQLIRQYKDDIIQQWIAKVRQEVPEAQNQKTLALQNDIPDLINDIIASLDQQQTEQDTHESSGHGRIRASFKDYSLSHVIQEYRLLMELILAFADQRVDLTVDDRNKIIYNVNIAIQRAAQAFFLIKQEEEGDAKRAAESLAEELQEVGQLRDDFISSLTHDLRSPLANTFSLLGLLRIRMPADESLSNILVAIQQSLERADTLVRNLLDVNLVATGAELPLHRVYCDLLHEVKGSIQTMDIKHQSSIILKSSASAIAGFYDCSALRRAIDNLISNAVKYGDPDRDITVTCQQQDTVIISVHNWGIPIPEDQQKKIFSRLYRVENQSGTKGWGIGLALVKGVVEAHLGEVAVKSDADTGTTFTITVPTSTS